MAESVDLKLADQFHVVVTTKHLLVRAQTLFSSVHVKTALELNLAKVLQIVSFWHFKVHHKFTFALLLFQSLILASLGFVLLHIGECNAL